MENNPLDELRNGSRGARFWNTSRPSETGHAQGPKACLQHSCLRYDDLSGCDLSGACLAKSSLVHARLDDSRLLHADLTDAVLLDTSLRGANLSAATLAGCWIERADFRGARLEKMNLTGATLLRCELTGLDFAAVDLTKTNLIQCNIMGSSFSGSQGVPASIGGSNLEGATLPESWRGLSGSLELLKNAARTAELLIVVKALAVVLLCARYWSLSGRDILLGDQLTALPVEGQNTSTRLFIVAAPLVVLALQQLSQLAVQRYWTRFARLPMRDKDGTPSSESGEHWLLTDIANHYIGIEHAAVDVLSALLAEFLIYVPVPLALLLIDVRIGPRNALAAFWLSVFLLISTFVAVRSHYIMRATLRYKRARPLKSKFAFLPSAAAVGFVSILLIAGFAALEMKKSDSRIFSLRHWGRGVLYSEPLFDVGRWCVRKIELLSPEAARWLASPRGMAVDGLIVAALLAAVAGNIYQKRKYTRKTLIIIWLAATPSVASSAFLMMLVLGELPLEPAIDMKGEDLRHATLAGAPLDGAYLADSDLRHADLRYADLRGANLAGSQLDGAQLERVHAWGLHGCPRSLPSGYTCRWMPRRSRRPVPAMPWRNATQSKLGAFQILGPELVLAGFDFSSLELEGLDLRDSQIVEANLIGTRLVRTNLASTYIIDTDLVGATLDLSDLSGTTVVGSNMTAASLVGAKLRSATFSHVAMENADLRHADLTRSVVSGGNWENADLRGARLRRAKVSGGRLTGALLVNTDLSFADLRYSNVTVAQLEEACVHLYDDEQERCEQPPVSLPFGMTQHRIRRCPQQSSSHATWWASEEPTICLSLTRPKTVLRASYWVRGNEHVPTRSRPSAASGSQCPLDS